MEQILRIWWLDVYGLFFGDGAAVDSVESEKSDDKFPSKSAACLLTWACFRMMFEIC